MLLLQCRTQPDELLPFPVSNRWRTVELDPEVFEGLSFDSPQSFSAAIKRINDGQVTNAEPFPPGATVYLIDTDKADRWEIALTVTKADG